MSLTPELIRTKLASLDQTQESIVAVSSWLMFHRRGARQIVEQWFNALQEASRKLNLIYLANEVSQQSRAKKRPEWPAAFATVLANAVEHVYRHSPTEMQGKLIRVVDVWKQRQVFPPEVLQDITTRIQPSSTSSVANGVPQGIPEDLKPLVMASSQLQVSASSSSFALGTSTSLYAKLIESDPSQRPSPDLYAARLRHLSKSIESSIEAVQSVIATREAVIKQLQTLEQSHFTALESEQSTIRELTRKTTQVNDALRDAERGTMSNRATTPEMEPPQVEALTPPGSPPKDEDEYVP